MNDTNWKPAPKVFVLLSEGNEGNGATIEFGSGEVFTVRPVNLGDFVRDNDLEPEQVNAIGALGVDEEMAFGGGAAPLFILRRVA